MKEHSSDLPTLISHIDKHVRLLEEIHNEISAAQRDDIPKLGKTPRAGVLCAGLLENYYTCAETVFVRVSQFFENNLSADRWHKDLLEKMTLQIEDVRPRLVSDESLRDLVELMRFRHFKRYYFGTAYDWTRLDELLGRVDRLHRALLRDIALFVDFLRTLNS